MTAMILMAITMMFMSSQAAMRKYNCTQTSTEPPPPPPPPNPSKGFECIEDWGIVVSEPIIY